MVEYKSLLTKAFRPNRLIRHYGCPTDTGESGLSRPGISHRAKSSSLNNGPLNQIFGSATLLNYLQVLSITPIDSTCWVSAVHVSQGPWGREGKARGHPEDDLLLKEGVPDPNRIEKW